MYKPKKITLIFLLIFLLGILSTFLFVNSVLAEAKEPGHNDVPYAEQLSNP